jgi:hypothetical protein
MHNFPKKIGGGVGTPGPPLCTSMGFPPDRPTTELWRKFTAAQMCGHFDTLVTLIFSHHCNHYDQVAF